MFGLRRSTIDFVLPSIIPASVDLSLTTVPSYWDEQFRIDHELNSKWQLALSSVGTIDTFELFATKDTDAGTKRFFNRTRFLRLTAARRTTTTGRGRANLALSGAAPGVHVRGRRCTSRSTSRPPTVTPRAEVIRTARQGRRAHRRRVARSAPRSRSAAASIDLALPHERREGEPMPDGTIRKDTSMRFKGAVWVPDFAAWTAVTANFDPRVRVTAGLRADGVRAARARSRSQPRGELQVKLTQVVDGAAVGGRVLAARRSSSPRTSTSTLEAERSTQTIVGLQYEPREGVRVQTLGLLHRPHAR